MNKLWKLESYYEDINNDNLVDILLKEKELKTEKARKSYLNADLKYLSDPYLIPDMDKAVKRIEIALKKDENILVYGDYDVDGVTSTALLYHYFKERFNKEIKYFLPDRIKDGYGLNKNAIKKIAEQKIDLIITVDCGITAFKEVELVNQLGMDIIITDHHTPADDIPDAAAVLNHHLVNKNEYFAKDIAGVGTAYKLTEAFEKNIVPNQSAFKDFQELQKKLLVITALGTVADIAPLENENRIFVKKGIEYFFDSAIVGLEVLLKNLKLKAESISAGQIGYIIAPPLNAAGRIYSADKALKLLITENEAKAERISEELIKINKQRQKEEEEIYQSALNKIKSIDLETEKSIVLYDSKWHSGIIGIVASRLVEKYNLPVILFAPDSDSSIAKGSCRSIRNLNIYKALKSIEEILLNFGGHKAAAGLSIKKDKIEEFKLAFKKYLENKLTQEDYTAVEKIDINFDFSYLNKNLIKSIEKFKPFGVGNPRPKFLFKNLKVNNCYTMGKENKHLKFNLDSNITAVAFNMGDSAAEISGQKIDLIAQPEINRWNGRENLQLKVVDYRILDQDLTPLLFSKNNFNFYDLRNKKKKKKILHKLLTDSFIKNSAVYINDPDYKDELEGKFPGHHFFSSFQNNFSEYDYLILYSLPFSLEHMHDIINKYSHSASKKIFLLFSKSEIDFNKKIIRHSCPSEKMLSDFIFFIKEKNKQENTKINLEQLQKDYFKSKKFSFKTRRLFKEMTNIIAELKVFQIEGELINCSYDGENQLDFKASIRYNKLSRQMEKFIHFKEEIFNENLFNLIEKVSNF
jgi:single-stranded-DNA-specific exonuclease